MIKSHFETIKTALANKRKVVNRWDALLWQRIYRVQYATSLFKIKYGYIVVVILFALFVVVSIILEPFLQYRLDPYFSNVENLAGLRNLLMTLGGALIGAAAIAFSLIMFAMQVNVERMPHGLFRKFSSDKKLLYAFSSTFVVAIIIAFLSLMPSKSWAVASVLFTIWGNLLIIILFLYSYRRALSLISPTIQLAIVVSDTKKSMNAWAKRAIRAEPLLESSNQENDREEPQLRSTHDMKRTAYFHRNPHWTDDAQRGILYCISFSRRYSEQGDHEVSRIALNSIVLTNAAYIEAKGKTFYVDNPFFNNPLSGDGLINDTLEHLRQNMQIAISRGDEQQIEQTLRTMASLCSLYLRIDYSNEHASKTHANLAARYLVDAVKSVVPRNMTDVLMEGVRLMGEIAQLMMIQADITDVTEISKKIALVSCAGVASENYRPVTLVGMEQLSKLTYELIRNESYDIRFVVKEMREDVKLVATLMLDVPDTPMTSIHSSFLAPYFSSSDKFLTWLTNLINALSDADADDENAKKVIHHIEQWSDQLYISSEELLLLAVEKRSHFTFDIINWISHVVKLLFAVLNSPSCDTNTQDKLKRNALRLIYVFSGIRDEEEVVTFVGKFNLTELLFDLAIDAHNRDLLMGNDQNPFFISEDIRKLLLKWTFKTGKYHDGRGTFNDACYALATLSLVMGRNGTSLLAEFGERLAKDDAPNREIKSRAARSIRRRASELYRNRGLYSSIEINMGRVDQERLKELLEKIADQLSPLPEMPRLI